MRSVGRCFACGGLLIIGFYLGALNILTSVQLISDYLSGYNGFSLALVISILCIGAYIVVVALGIRPLFRQERSLENVFWRVSIQLLILGFAFIWFPVLFILV